jgi:hypothetical protein
MRGGRCEMGSQPLRAKGGEGCEWRGFDWRGVICCERRDS